MAFTASATSTAEALKAIGVEVSEPDTRVNSPPTVPVPSTTCEGMYSWRVKTSLGASKFLNPPLLSSTTTVFCLSVDFVEGGEYYFNFRLLSRLEGSHDCSTPAGVHVIGRAYS